MAGEKGMAALPMHKAMEYHLTKKPILQFRIYKIAAYARHHREKAVAVSREVIFTNAINNGFCW